MGKDKKKNNKKEKDQKTYFLDQPGRKFTNALASKEPVPGGGGAAAYCGAIGTALGRMVAALTVGKAKYADVADEITELEKQATELQNELESLVDLDAEAFKPLAACYKMPEDTAMQKMVKHAAIQGCLVKCAEVPLAMMRSCVKAINLQRTFAEKGSVLAISDAGCGAAILKGALAAAMLNVTVNTKTMDQRAMAKKIDDEAAELFAKGSEEADAVYAVVLEKIRG